MMTYYDDLSVTIKNKQNNIKEIVGWLEKNFVFDMKNLAKKENGFSFYGDETDPLYMRPETRRIPSVEDIFKGITIAFPSCEYKGYAKIDTGYSENVEYFITCENGVLKIESPVYAVICDFYMFDEYEEFYEEFDPEDSDIELITEDEFNKYKEVEEERLYIIENKFYTEKEYYDIPYDVIYCENINELFSSQKEESTDKEKLLVKIEEDAEYMEKVPEDLKNNREFVIEAVRKNGFAITYLNNKLALDREIALEAVKSDPYVVDFLMGDLSEDEELIEISESIRKTFPEEDWE